MRALLSTIKRISVGIFVLVIGVLVGKLLWIVTTLVPWILIAIIALRVLWLVYSNNRH